MLERLQTAAATNDPGSQMNPGDEFMDLSDMDTLQFDTEWQQKAPMFWTADDILNWMYHTAAEMPIDFHEGDNGSSSNQSGCNLRLLSGENWRDVDGIRLCSMTIDEFAERDRLHGHLFYKLLHQLPLDDPFDDPTMLDSVYCDDDFACICHEFNLSSQWPMNSGCLPSIDSFRPSPQPSVAIPQTTDISFSDTGMDVTSPKEFLFKLNPIIIQPAIEPDTSAIQTIDCGPTTATSPMPVAESRSAKRRPPKKPTTGDAMMRRTSIAESSSSNANSDSGDSGCELEGVRQQQKPRRTKKNAIHLWQFMLALLDDSRYNPECVKWLNRADGVFRIVQSAEIARLWGIKKGNPKMTFEKMSRALRWNRDNGFLADVPKNCGYPKKLCFRFGALAEHWDGSSTIPIGKVIGVSGLPPTSESDLDICNQ